MNLRAECVGCDRGTTVRQLAGTEVWRDTNEQPWHLLGGKWICEPCLEDAIRPGIEAFVDGMWGPA